MTDNWDEITALLKKTPPVEPKDSARNDAISKAMQAFDEKNASSRQGIRLGYRLMDTVRTVLGTLSGEKFMKKSYIVAGGLCASVLAVALLNSSQLSDIMAPKLTGVLTLPEQVQSTTNTQPQKPIAEAEKEPTRTEEINSHDLSGTLTTLPPLAPPPPPQMVVGASVPPPPILSSPIEETFDLKAEKSEHKKDMLAGGRALFSKENGKPDSLIYPATPAPKVFVVDSDTIAPSYHDQGRDKFKDIKENPIKLVKEEPVSTFSIDVDTSSYSFMRASLNNNVLPQHDAVRIEEMVNYFPYDYAVPENKSEPFKTSLSVFPTPWNKDTKLLHIGIKGYQITQAEKPHSNLVFLLDTSGSMEEPNKLPLLQNSMKLLLDSLKPDDTVAIVTYAGSAGTVLEPTAAREKSKIINALDNLNAGGSTAGAEGIRQAYQLAEQNFDKEGVNRVILATDGDFNVGITDPQELKSFIERKRETGVFLSVLGFGMGNYNDELMQELAQNGNGNAAYIDSINEARKALVEEASSTLFPIAKDVKIQVEFNPATVAEYRLVGYETRLLNREDFNNDKVDAGDIGAGHTVTALYEITPVGSKAVLMDDLRYRKPEVQPESSGNGGEYAFVKIRYKLPESSTSKLITSAVDSAVEKTNLSEVPTEARFATAVAAFAQILRGDEYTKSYSYEDVIALAQSAKGEDKFGYRAEFINLIRLAKNAPAMEKLY